MGFNIENVAKQIAVLAPKTQAKLFESLAKLTGQSSLKALAENYQSLLSQIDSATSPEVTAIETDATSKPRLYPSADEMTSLQHNRIGESVAVYGLAQQKAAKEDKSFEELYAIFDGEVLKPEGKFDLDLNTRYRLLVEKPISRFPEIKNRAFRRIRELAISMGIRDFAEQHDHYLYGVPKK
jgi:hypothetical protein